MARFKQDPLYAQISTHVFDGNYPSGPRPVGGQSSSLGLTTSITQNDVTVTFAAPVEYGKYRTGSHWIKDAGNGITVASKLPAETTDANGKVIHGSMVNPTVGGNQGFHETQFTADQPNTIEAPFWESALKVSYPLALTAGDAFLAGVSREAGQNANWEGDVPGSHPVMKAIEVFTIVDHVPVTTELRPSPVDRSQTRYDTANIIWSRLPSLSTSGVTLPNYTAYDGYDPSDHYLRYFSRGLERFWPVFFHDYNARQFHPIDHMPDYHQDAGTLLSEALVGMCTDASQAEKEELVINFCQVGIDYYEVGKQQVTGDSSWWRAPMVVTGYLLGDDAMRDCYLTGSVTQMSREAEKFYYYADRIDQDNNETGSVPAGETWAGHKVFFRKKYSAAGEYESRYPSEFTTTHFTDEFYRRSIDVLQMMGQAFVLNKMGLQAATDYKPFFEMFARWTTDADLAVEHATLHAGWSSIGGTEPVLEYYTKSLGTTFMDDMFAAHKSGTVWPDNAGAGTRTL